MRVAAVGAVLVGGASTRMGRPKSLIEIDGTTLVRRAVAVLTEVGCTRVVAIGPAHLADGVARLDDLYPGEGPLGGILTALAAGAPALVIACDLPSLDVATLDALLAAADAAESAATAIDAVVAVTDRPEPLCALWLASGAALLQRAFDSGERAVHRAMAALHVVEVPVAVANVRNVNTPDDLQSR